MTSVRKADARRQAAALKDVLRALWTPRTWQATSHAVLGALLGAAAGATLGGVFLLWGAAVWSLAEGPTGGWVLAVLYAVVAVTGLIPAAWCVRGFGVLQRERFQAVLGVEIEPPSYPKGRWPSRPIREWRASATWRQLGYHLLALPIGVLGGAWVLFCWSAPVLTILYAWPQGTGSLAVTIPGLVLPLAAPWSARAVTALDVRAARALLGPGRAEELAHRVESLSRSRSEVIAAADAERRRIERDLHDGAQQRLVSLAMNLGMARVSLGDVPPSVREAVEHAHDDATQALAELRELVRGLHPAVLNDRGLDAALPGIAARSPVPVRLRVHVPERCSPSIEAIAYFVVSEALTNVAKHARASYAEVTVERTGDRLRIIVTDDGQGGATLDQAGEGGLTGLAHRAAAVDGTLTVHSPSGGPTTITVELPCAS